MSYYVPRIVPAATDYDTEAANTAVTITLAATAGRAHAIYRVMASYSATPTGGKLQIKRGTTVVQEIDVVGTLVDIEFSDPIGGNLNEAVSVVLAAGGAGIIGKLNVLHKVSNRA